MVTLIMLLDTVFEIWSGFLFLNLFKVPSVLLKWKSFYIVLRITTGKSSLNYHCMLSRSVVSDSL